MTDPSRIVFGISSPPHARAPIARALNQRRFSVGCLPSRVVAAEPGIYTHARFAHLLLHGSQDLPPPSLLGLFPPDGGLQERANCNRSAQRDGKVKDWLH